MKVTRNQINRHILHPVLQYTHFGMQLFAICANCTKNAVSTVLSLAFSLEFVENQDILGPCQGCRPQLPFGCAFPDDRAFDLQGRDGLIGIVADQFGILFKLADTAAGIEPELDFARFAWFEHLVARHFDATAGCC